MALEQFGELLAEGPSLDELLDETVAAARARSSQVAVLPEAEVRRHVRAMLQAAATALSRGGPAEADLTVAERLGADRARQGVPVAALLDGFQAGRSHLVQAMIKRGRAAGLTADDLLEAVTKIDAISTALEHRMVHAHRIMELELVRTARDSSAQRLRALLHGEPVDRPLDPARRYHCVVSEVSDPAAARPLEAALGVSGFTGMVDGRLTAVVTRLPEPVGDIPLLVAAPAAPPERLPEMYGLCRRAAEAARGLTGLRHLTELALITATATEPGLGALLAAELLEPLDPADPFHRDLAGTALAHLDQGCRIEPTAAALHVHPNTVKYRLRRLQELTGRPLSGSAVYTAHWWWALRTWLEPPG